MTIRRLQFREYERKIIDNDIISVQSRINSRKDQLIIQVDRNRLATVKGTRGNDIKIYRLDDNTGIGISEYIMKEDDTVELVISKNGISNQLYPLSRTARPKSADEVWNILMERAMQQDMPGEIGVVTGMSSAIDRITRNSRRVRIENRVGYRASAIMLQAKKSRLRRYDRDPRLFMFILDRQHYALLFSWQVDMDFSSRQCMIYMRYRDFQHMRQGFFPDYQDRPENLMWSTWVNRAASKKEPFMWKKKRRKYRKRNLKRFIPAANRKEFREMMDRAVPVSITDDKS